MRLKFLYITFLFPLNFYAQIDSSLLKRTQKDSTKQALNMDAVYNRPFLNIGKTPIAVGGYLEANWQRLSTDGVSEGHQLQARRLTIFMSSAISKRVKFLSEIEFEDGGKEIAIEFASVDVEFHPLVNFRGGIIMNPIGAFNQNHDGPKWEFTDRPISSTQMLPSTFSNAGVGLFGKKYSNNWMIGYEAYFSGSFDNSIIENEENKTFLPAAKDNPERFEEINSGLPLFTGKIAIRNSKIGELGLSYMGGVYNKFQDDGVIVDEKRRVDVFALDFNTTLPKIKTFITSELAWIKIDVPSTYGQQFGNKQFGGFIDIVQPLLTKNIFGWKNAVLNIACRLEYVDWNVGTFNETGGNIGEDIWSVMPAISFRPTSQTVFRLNYRFQKQRDILGNPPANTAGFNIGVSTYF
ncbi:hypothetical protein [Flavobacterium gawalongense]|uniref:Porin n=1 Tax=Flavobacterium gawalongense TaxID=2594432 RepID=A0A553BK36_9FLAO|nr:hypothetical protein [Flavobacterium gawalongense]TRX00330.1 hypothetical protein FNW33_12180 [Flavobacterium gawalongense]TRX08388.1 hypothetical protein FNW12_03870 [Flavobacterium gawalongense]TRX08616.1 hypothetical protein FNW11_11210 [Flavobacterium gawalongense]TRX09599.1 hypothetical protein FNW10_11095 [Flavobacterium gawalongense]TRX25608.1 hypothetical protein FNW38_11070 [Flavobacterium gawalongense]